MAKKTVKKVIKKEIEVKKEMKKESKAKYITLELVRDDLGINIPKGETITELSEERTKLLLNHKLIKEV